MPFNKLLAENLEVLSKLKEAFKDSVEHIWEIDITSLETFRDYEPIDAFFDRFERIIDSLFQSTFRTLYQIENRIPLYLWWICLHLL